MSRGEATIILCIVLLLGLTTFAIVNAAALAEEIDIHEPRGLPAIENCEKELWDRIRYKC